MERKYAHHDGARVLEELGDAAKHHEHASAQVDDAAEKWLVQSPLRPAARACCRRLQSRRQRGNVQHVREVHDRCVELRSSRVMWLGGGEAPRKWLEMRSGRGRVGAGRGEMEERFFVGWMMKAMWNGLSRTEAVVDR